jgi:hypothetical protein
MLLADDDPEPWPVPEDADADETTDVVHAPPAVVVVTVIVAVDFVLVPVVTGVELAVDDFVVVVVVVVVVVLLLVPPPPIFNPLMASQSAIPAPTGMALVNPPTMVPLIMP